VKFIERWGGDKQAAIDMISRARGTRWVDFGEAAGPVPTAPVQRPAVAIAPPDSPAVTNIVNVATGSGNLRAFDHPTVSHPTGANLESCFDRNCPTPAIRFIPANQFLPPDRESPEMRQLHKEVDNLDRDIADVENSLERTRRNDDTKRADLEKKRESLRSQRTEKKQQYDNIVRRVQLN
jgi:hypothetical protein